MKRKIFLLLTIVIVGSCRTKQSEKTAGADSTVVMIKPDTSNVKTDSHYFWTSELDHKLGLVMKKTTPVSNDSLTATNMIHMLNKQHPEIHLDLLKVSGDSIFTAIKKSTYLTQQMGSSGADSYLAEVTYNLTELTGVNFVDIRFKEGDHAQPGVYSRTDFVRAKN